MKAALAALLFAASLFTACAEQTDSAPTGRPVVMEETALGHCRVVCPKCHPGQVCPYMCIQQCNYPKGYCELDSDCVAAADYCHGGCDCSATSIYDDASSSCPQPVNCFADACLNHAASCDVATHQCVLN